LKLPLFWTRPLVSAAGKRGRSLVDRHVRVFTNPSTTSIDIEARFEAVSGRA
jgi:hypothetical protein